mgnify:CR=1 FL=1
MFDFSVMFLFVVVVVANLVTWTSTIPLCERRLCPCFDDNWSSVGGFFELSEPKGKNPKGKAPKETGIVVALRQDNYEEALRDLRGVLLDISGDDVNTDYDPSLAAAMFQVMQWKIEIEEMIVCVEQLIED